MIGVSGLYNRVVNEDRLNKPSANSTCLSPAARCSFRGLSRATGLAGYQGTPGGKELPQDTPSLSTPL